MVYFKVFIRLFPSFLCSSYFYPRVHHFLPLPLLQTLSVKSSIHNPTLHFCFGKQNKSCNCSVINVNKYSSKCKKIRVWSAEQVMFVYFFKSLESRLKKMPRCKWRKWGTRVFLHENEMKYWNECSIVSSIRGWINGSLSFLHFLYNSQEIIVVPWKRELLEHSARWWKHEEIAPNPEQSKCRGRKVKTPIVPVVNIKCIAVSLWEEENCILAPIFPPSLTNIWLIWYLYILEARCMKISTRMGLPYPGCQYIRIEHDIDDASGFSNIFNNIT